jgi:ABC-2 type transport system ATP-binding protein
MGTVSALEVRNLTKRFGSVAAVRDASFTVAAGRIVGLLGQNGAGKTTLLRCLAGLSKISAGTVLLDGCITHDRWQNFLLVPETPEVYPDLSVHEHLEFVARSRRIADYEPKIAELEREFNLERYSATLGAALSKGIRQKTLIASALVASPRVVMLDEPFIGLDPHGQAELQVALRGLAARGVIVIVSTHLLDLAHRLCDEVLVLHEGAIYGKYDAGDVLDDTPVGLRFVAAPAQP